MDFDDNDWIDGFDIWEDVWAALHEDWVRIDDDAQRLRLEREDDELFVVELDRQLRARQRRGLHRMGFRPTAALRVTVWQWDVQDALQRVDLRDFSAPFERVFDAWDPAARPAKIELTRTRLARAHLLTEQTQRVVREVFRSRPQDLSISVPREKEWWEEEDDDEDWQLPAS